MHLGCIGDDFTGSTDLANTLSKAGFRAVQYNGVPQAPAHAGVEAGVVALKTRTVGAAEAIKSSLAALEWLREQGCTQFYFKYCSTFDSTPKGNIGPVLDAMMDALGARRALVCPAFPATGRTVFAGHLFVGDQLLNESGMENHPLTPMTDADIRRWLARQSRHSVDHIALTTVRSGTEAIRAAIEGFSSDAPRHIVIDTTQDDDLLAIGRAVKNEVLVSGGSGLGMGLAENFDLARGSSWSFKPAESNSAVIALAGSCSTRTREQVDAHKASNPNRLIDVESVVNGTTTPDDLAEWAFSHAHEGIPLIYSSTDPQTVRMLQDRFGREKLAHAIESLLAHTAKALVQRGVGTLIVAGGETSGAIVSALDINGFEIGPEIDPGVPVVQDVDGSLSLALKSGNFGAINFFEKAGRVIKGGEH